MEALKLYSNKQVSAIAPLSIKEPLQINEVMSTFQAELGFGKIVVAYEPTSIFKVCVVSWAHQNDC